MAMNSINTNLGAQVALASLNRTTDELSTVQKRISTGYRVADARDDGAAFAVAERVRGDIAATTSANEQLGGVKGLLDVTQSALQNVSSTLVKLKELTVKLADGTITTDQRTQYGAQITELAGNIKSFLSDAKYNGTTALTTTAVTFQVVRAGDGSSYQFESVDAFTQIFDQISALATASQSNAAAALTASGAVNTAIANTLTALNNFGSYSRYVDNQINFNKTKIDAQEAGLGSLVDADLAKESARLQSLQIRQQLGTQSLSIANQAPQSLLSLFR